MSLRSHRPYSHLDNDDDRFLRRRHIRKDHRKRLHRCLLGLVAVLTLLLVAVIVAAVCLTLLNRRGHPPFSSAAHRESSAAFEDALVVRTNCGEYIGTIEDGAFVFKGIPYAKAPVGHLRWKKPISWWSDGEWCGRRERRRAHKYAKPCFQMDPDTRKFRGKEDCLYLNVWSPRLDTSAGLDVFVWVHGGFHLWGSGHEPGHCPSGRVAKALNAVFVSFNYRLGALGWLALDALSERPQDARGNYGLWDQVVALHWVRHNVRAFGGDPDRVTLFGADSGAASILALRASPAAQGLFRAAWLLGPALVQNRTFEDLAQHNAAFFLKRAGCQNATCLRRMTPRALTEAFVGREDPSFRVRDQNDLPIKGMYSEQLMVLDGQLITSPPLAALESGEGMDIPTLVGTAAQAADLWPGPENLPHWNWDQLSKYVVTSLDSFDRGLGEAAMELYNVSDSSDKLTPELVYSNMVSDLRQNCPVDRFFHVLANSSSSRVYRYVFTAKPSAPVKVLGYPSRYAFHPWDAVAFFDHMEHHLDHPSAADLRFRDRLQQLARAFARSGGRSPGVPDWEPFPGSVALLAGDGVRVVRSYHRGQCGFWRDRIADDFAWVS